MTQPHLMNCSHHGDGWCLKCVGDLHADYRRLQAVAEAAEAKIRAEQASKWSERGYTHEPETENLIAALRVAGYLKTNEALPTNQGEQP